MLNSTTYDLTQKLQEALFQAGIALQPDGKAPPPASHSPLMQVQRGYAESAGWILTQAQEFDPEPLSVERFRVRAVWSSQRIVCALLDLMTAEKWFDRIKDDYYLTEEGRMLIQAVKDRWNRILIPLEEHLSEGDILSLEKLMRRVLDASLTSAVPRSKWSLQHSRRRAPADDAPVIMQLFHHSSDFNAYRDDSHMAALQPSGVEAFAWEAFSLVCNGAADTAKGVFDQLTYRGYSISEFAEGLHDISRRGWLETQGVECYAVTLAGRKVLEEVEYLTDQYFFSAWNCLSAAEIQELLEGMHNLGDKLLAMASAS
jgi:DNA-binding MarR family transcriptional regulator